MITQASELLALFIEEEKKKLNGFVMPHMPTLGSAYEAITKQGIDKEFVIPKSLNLHVVSGFIEIAGEMIPQQIDCMLVEGDGRQYGITDQYIYDINRILCIFEVKKTLTKADFSDAFDHLGGIRRKFAEHFEEKLRGGTFEPDISHARNAFAQITGKMAPTHYLGIHQLPKTEAILFYTLVQEQHAPVSIVHGYEGYKTEEGLRSAFIGILEERAKISGQGLGAPSLPTLVTSNNFCLIKGNGHPYLAIKDKKSWVVIFSTRHNPARIILELIWSKISSHFDAEMPYGLDLDMETIAPLLIAEPHEVGEQVGWVYNSLEYKERRLVRDEQTTWEPSKVGAAELSAINIMAMQGGYLPLDSGMDEYLKKEHNHTLDQVVKSLLQTRAFAKDGEYLRPVSSVTHVLTNDDGSGYLAIERNRFDAWCEKNSVQPAYMNMLFLE